MRRAALVLFAGAFAAAACQLIAGIDDRVATRFRDPCPHAYPPDAAAGPDGVDVPEAVFALDLAFSANTDAGFDLDGLCTTAVPATRSCTPVCDAGITDDPQGRDNSAGVLLGSLLKALGQANSGANDRFRLVLRLSEYNGTPEDPSVRVELYRSHGIAPVSADAAVRPARDGSDSWTYTADSAIPATNVAYSDRKGIVTGGHVIVRVPELGIDYGFSTGPNDRLRILLRDAVVNIPIPRPGEATAGGVIAGTWAVNDLFSSLSAIQDPSSDAGFICGNENTVYTFLKSRICNGADMARGESDTCNALSATFDVDVASAKLGDTGDLPDPPSGCGGNWTDDCANVTCGAPP